jgi:transcriptional regulator with XRE-family HTH domain
VTTAPTTYWDDLIEDLRDPEFVRAYVTESLRVETIDRLVNDLDEARTALGLSKAELARAISTEPAVIRRLLSPRHRNPTIGTLAEVAAALGYRVALIPMADDEREQVAETLRAGAAKDRERLVRDTEGKRASRRSVDA